MAQISIQRDPSQITKVERYSEQSCNLLDWLCQYEEPDFGELHATVTLNGKVILNTWDSEEPEESNRKLDIQLGAFDSVGIIIRPAGIDPLTAAIIVVTAIVSAAISIALAPKPSIPTTVTDPTDDGGTNNQLNAAQNAYRPRKAIPDIAGQVVSYPNFAQLSYFQYQNNERVFREIFVIGVGRYALGDVKIGEDLLLAGEGNTFTYRENGNTPPNLINVRPNPNSQEVDILPP